MRAALVLRGGDLSHVDPSEFKPQDAGNATAQHGRDAELRPAGGLRHPTGIRRARYERDHGDRRDGGYCQDRRDARDRASIEPVHADRLRPSRQPVSVCRNAGRLKRALESRRLFAPEVRRTWWRVVAARWNLVGERWRPGQLARSSLGTERHKLLPGPEPVAGEAHDFAPWLRLMLFLLGLPTFLHRVDALFQRFLRRRRQCRPYSAVL